MVSRACIFAWPRRGVPVCVSILMVPGRAFLIPQFLVVQKLGWSTASPGWCRAFSSVYATFLLRQFWRVPKEMEEAA